MWISQMLTPSAKELSIDEDQKPNSRWHLPLVENREAEDRAY